VPTTRNVLWLTCFFVFAASAQTDVRGIFIYTNDISQITNAIATQLKQSFSIPGVDGAAIVIGWDAIEPSLGQYEWTLLDQWIAQVVALGKKIDLVIPSGSATPSWLFQPAPAGAGAQELKFTVSPHNGQTSVCETDNIAAPWDPAYLAQWDAMLAAISAHLKSAGTYNNITLVRLAGINRTTEEIRLPAETAQSTGQACVSDAITIWKQAGYQASLVVQAWNAILASYQKSFADKTFSVSLIPSASAFPGINNSGYPDLTQTLMAAAAQKFLGHVVIQFDFLMPGEAASADVIADAQNLGTMTAFQTNEYLGGQGAACSEPVTNPTPCTATTFLDLLNTGIYPLGQGNSLRAQYIEVFHDNAAAFQGDILQAHFELVPPAISVVANAEGESATIAPNTWVEIKGSGLSLTGDSRVWQGSDFAGNQMPTRLDNISATVNGRNAFIYYISPTQINILTPPDAMSGPVQVVVTNNGTTSASSTAQARALSPSLFVFNGGPYVAAVHLDGSLIGPSTLYPDASTPAKPGETVEIYANGFGPINVPIVSGSITQSGTLSPLPVIQIGGVPAMVQFAGLVGPGEFQFNVIIPASLSNGDQFITVNYAGVSTQPGALITIHN
jgi:uncharacterized protein (TIGR03437 family)